jgi:hypothetical protein
MLVSASCSCSRQLPSRRGLVNLECRSHMFARKPHLCTSAASYFANTRQAQTRHQFHVRIPRVRSEVRFVQLSAVRDDSSTTKGTTDIGSGARDGTVTTQSIGGILSSPFDADIFGVALPALASIMLDAVMLLIDTGESSPARIDILTLQTAYKM